MGSVTNEEDILVWELRLGGLPSFISVLSVSGTEPWGLVTKAFYWKLHSFRQMALQAPRSQIEAFSAQIGSEVSLGSTGFPDTLSRGSSSWPQHCSSAHLFQNLMKPLEPLVTLVSALGCS